MAAWRFTRRIRGLAMGVALVWGSVGCRKKALEAAAPSGPLHGVERLPFFTPSLSDVQPLQAPPTTAELAAYPLDGAARPANLSLPVDWRQDPFKSRAWRMRLNAWDFMPPLLLGYDVSGKPELLRAGIDLALDWVRKYPEPRREKKNEFAWYDMAVATRAATLGYLIRAGDVAGLFKGQERDLLLAAAIAHAKWLATPANYRRRHNHGLFDDSSLLMLCAQLDQLKECEAWRPLARQRFAENLGLMVSASGVHLEQSPSYHFTVIRLLENRLRVDDDAVTRHTLELMRDAGPWFVQPDGRLPQLGDTFDAPAPAWAAAAASKLAGARLFSDAGYYSVKTEDAQLLVVGAHHTKTHKHADDLSFVLSEGKRRVFVDSGFFSYNKSPVVQFLASAPAHNVFLVDDEYVMPSELPQVSLRATGQALGWFAVAGDDLHAAPDLHHERTWLYRPGDVLLIVDRFKGDAKRHELSRYFHLAPDFETWTKPNGVAFRSGNLEGEVFDASSAATQVRVEKGRREAPFQGIVSQDEDVLIDAPAIQFVTAVAERASTTLLSVVEVGKRRSHGHYRLIEGEAEGKFVIELPGQRISVARAGHELTLELPKIEVR
jgi:hypothetical protein